MRRSLALAALMLVGVESVAAAQSATPSALSRVPAGSLVRVWSSTSSMEKREAAVISTTGDTLLVRLEGRDMTALRALPYGEIQRVDRLVPRSRASGAARGFGFGLLTALAFDAALAGYAGTQNQGDTDFMSFIIGAYATPVIIAGGTIIGAVRPGVRWSTEYRR